MLGIHPQSTSLGIRECSCGIPHMRRPGQTSQNHGRQINNESCPDAYVPTCKHTIANNTNAQYRQLRQYRRRVVAPFIMIDAAIIIWNILEAHAHHMHGVQCYRFC